LEKSALMSSVEIQWPSGAKQVINDLPADFIYTVVEDKGITQKVPFSRR
jgi:hypothetical protein